MPRQPRLDIPGALYHVIARGIERRPVFRDDKDRSQFVRRLALLLKENQISCYAWALLDNHFHLLIKSPVLPLQYFMRRLMTGHAVAFNHRHRRSGHLFQNRYHAIVCQEETYFLQLIRYIHLNPLRAGMLENLEALAGYPWCGHAAILGVVSRPWQEIRDVLARFGRSMGPAREVYGRFVAEGLGDLKEPAQAKLFEKVRRAARPAFAPEKLEDPRILGDEDFVEKMLAKSSPGGGKECGKGRRAKGFDDVARAVCRQCEVEVEKVVRVCRGKAGVRARALIAYRCRQELGMSVTEIGKRLGIGQPSASKLVMRGREEGKRAEKLYAYKHERPKDG